MSAVLASSFIQKLEKYSIAFFSISDMVTDIIMTTRYFEQGQTGEENCVGVLTDDEELEIPTRRVGESVVFN